MTLDSCALCQTSISHFPIVDHGNSFCCAGCHAVYNILASKKQIENYRDSSVFQQALKAGLISNPTLLEDIREQKAKTASLELEKFHLEILEMWCPSCAEVIKLMLLQERGVVNCVIDYATDLASIEFAPQQISKEKIRKIIASIGYKPLDLDSSERHKVNQSLYIRFGIAAFFSLNAMMFAYPLYATYFDASAHEDGKIFAWLSCFSSIPIMTYCLWPIWQRFITSLKVGLVGMEALVITGVSSAFGLSVYELIHDSNQVYFDSMAVIVTFVLLGKIIENKAKFSAKESLFRLNRSLPRRGRKRFEDGTTAFVNVKEIAPQDIVVAYAGERIILDGEIIEGEGICDESLMTGEAFPIPKKIGSQVMGGSILQHGSIAYKIHQGKEASALHRIIQIVENDLGHKSAYVRAADKIVRWFVPTVFFIAFSTSIISYFLQGDAAWHNTLAVLLIACPCAIGIAAPLAESQMLHQLAALGVIVRNRGCLALLPRITTFIFDKTGTVTEGHFQVLAGINHLSIHEKKLLKALSKPSNHLICRAVFNAIEEESYENVQVEEFPAKGMKGIHEEKILLFGSRSFFKENGIHLAEEMQEFPGITSVVYFSPDGIKAYRIDLGDTVRGQISDILKSLNAKTVLLSGDSTPAVAAVAVSCRFSEFHSQASPLQKRDFVENLRQSDEIVCMVGDGINDAPALTAAHIGISVVSAADISIQVSDVLLTTSHLKVLPQMLKIASFGQKILKQNLFWAFFYNCIGIGLAVFGLLSPIFAAFAMTASSLLVLFNSRRI